MEEVGNGASLCPSCSSVSVQLDDTEGVLVCFACGHVLDEELLTDQQPFYEEEEPRGQAGPGAGTAFASHVGKAYDPARAREKRIADDCDAVDALAGNLRLPGTTIAEAHSLVRQAREQRWMYGGPSGPAASIAAFLYVAARQDRQALTLLDLAHATGLPPPIIAAVTRRLTTALGLAPPRVSIRGILVRMVAQLLADLPMLQRSAAAATTASAGSTLSAAAAGSSCGGVAGAVRSTAAVAGGGHQNILRGMDAAHAPVLGSGAYGPADEGAYGGGADDDLVVAGGARGDSSNQVQGQVHHNQHPLTKQCHKVLDLVLKLGVHEGRHPRSIAASVISLTMDYRHPRALSSQEASDMFSISYPQLCDAKRLIVEELLSTARLLPLGDAVQRRNVLAYLDLLTALCDKLTAIKEAQRAQAQAQVQAHTEVQAQGQAQGQVRGGAQG